MEISADPQFQERGIDWDQVHGVEFALLDRVIDKTRSLRGAS